MLKQLLIDLPNMPFWQQLLLCIGPLIILSPILLVFSALHDAFKPKPRRSESRFSSSYRKRAWILFRWDMRLFYEILGFIFSRNVLIALPGIVIILSIFALAYFWPQIHPFMMELSEGKKADGSTGGKPHWTYFVIPAFTALGGLLTLTTYWANHWQRQRHFEQEQLAKRFESVQNLFTSTDRDTRSMAAHQLTEMGKMRLPGSGVTFRSKNFPYFIPVVKQLTTKLHMEQDAAVRGAVAEGLIDLTRFACDKGNSKLAYDEIMLLIEAQRMAQKNLAHALGEYCAMIPLSENSEIGTIRKVPKEAWTEIHTLAGLHFDENTSIRALQKTVQYIQFESSRSLYRAIRAVLSPEEQSTSDNDKRLTLQRTSIQLSEIRNTLCEIIQITSQQSENTQPLSLSNLILCGVNLSRADLKQADLSLSDLSMADLSNAELREANLAGAKLSAATLNDACLNGIHLRKADLRVASLGNVELIQADLSSSYLEGALISEANLMQANLSDAKASGAYLGGSNLSKAKLARADLSKTYLGPARGAIGVNFDGADLRGAYLTMADLSGANFAEANLAEAYLTDIQNAPQSLAHANFGEPAEMSDRFRSQLIDLIQTYPGYPWLDKYRALVPEGMPGSLASSSAPVTLLEVEMPIAPEPLPTVERVQAAEAEQASQPKRQTRRRKSTPGSDGESTES